MIRIQKNISWIKSCKTIEQLATMERYLDREFKNVPPIVKMVMSNQKVCI